MSSGATTCPLSISSGGICSGLADRGLWDSLQPRSLRPVSGYPRNAIANLDLEQPFKDFTIRHCLHRNFAPERSQEAFMGLGMELEDLSEPFGAVSCLLATAGALPRGG